MLQTRKRTRVLWVEAEKLWLTSCWVKREGQRVRREKGKERGGGRKREIKEEEEEKERNGGDERARGVARTNSDLEF